MDNRLKQLRLEHGYSTRALAEALTKNGLKTTSMTISRYERGEREPKLATWQKIADFFEVSVPYIQGYDSNVDATIDKWKNSQIIAIIDKLSELQNNLYDFSYDRKVFDALSVLLSIYNENPKNSYIIDMLNDVIMTLEYFNGDLSREELFLGSSILGLSDEADEESNEDIILLSSLQFEHLLRQMNDNMNMNK